ncbi:hypothetical protein [Sphingorhabdus sp. Alg231-15]|uniref:hypothetical protein n=1 Tax=Sphingorhabdus sp. Alg231-15 TaxID=1922222 RepID=UPI000D5509DF
MKKIMLYPLAALLIGGPALAQGSKTVTVDNNRISGTKTITRDGAGTVVVDGDVTRKSDGATASHDYNRTRTETGWTASGQQTDFKGRSRGFDYQRDRTENGFEASGSGYNRRGDQYDYSAYGTRGENSRERGRTVSRNGDVVYDRLDNASRVDGKIVRNTQVTRDPSFRPKKRVKPLRVKNPKPRRFRRDR